MHQSSRPATRLQRGSGIYSFVHLVHIVHAVHGLRLFLASHRPANPPFAALNVAGHRCHSRLLNHPCSALAWLGPGPGERPGAKRKQRSPHEKPQATPQSHQRIGRRHPVAGESHCQWTFTRRIAQVGHTQSNPAAFASSTAPQAKETCKHPVHKGPFWSATIHW